MVLAVIPYDDIPGIADASVDLYVKFITLLCVQAIETTKLQAVDRLRAQLGDQVHVAIFEKVHTTRKRKRSEGIGSVVAGGCRLAASGGSGWQAA